MVFLVFLCSAKTNQDLNSSPLDSGLCQISSISCSLYAKFDTHSAPVQVERGNLASLMFAAPDLLLSISTDLGSTTAGFQSTALAREDFSLSGCNLNEV